MADEIIGEGLRLLNEPAEDTLTATQVAKTFNMTVWDFNHVLSDMGIQYRRYPRTETNKCCSAAVLQFGRRHAGDSPSVLRKLRTAGTVPEYTKGTVPSVYY